MTNSWIDWYNAYFRDSYTLEATSNGAGISEDVESLTINGSFSLINKLIPRDALIRASTR